jgi:hypothetical protein
MFTKSIAAQRPFKLALIASFAMVAAAVSAPSLATDSTAGSTAEVMVPITLTKNTDLKFGKFAGTTGGDVTISPLGTRSNTAGVVLAAGTVSAASFAIKGSPDANISVSLAGSTTVLTGPSGATMNLALASDLTGALLTGTATLNATGDQALNVGGTLTVAANQAAGSYTGTIAASVNYN